jgi:hypothetical protein
MSRDSLKFEARDYMRDDKQILVGRSPTCDVQINDKLLSKIHCHIRLFVDRSDPTIFEWVVIDGHQAKTSCNGTWVYIASDTPVQNNFTFKANQTVFNCKLQTRATG